MASVKAGRPLINYLLKVVLLVGLSPNDNLVKVIVYFAKDVHMLVRKGGAKFASIYLKACYVTLQQSLGKGSLHDMTPLGCRVSRTLSGLPKIIPASHRLAIRRSSFIYIKLWLSLFSFYRVQSLPYKLDLSSVTDFSSWDRTFTSELSNFVIIFFDKIRTFSDDDWLWDCKEDRKSAMFLKVTPNFPQRSTPVGPDLAGSPKSLIVSQKTWANSPLLPYLRDWLKTTSNHTFLGWLDKGIELSKSWDINLIGLSKFGFKEEAAGKLRTFALVDPITQWVLKGLHDKISNIQRSIPQDGMFDQTKPLDKLLRDYPLAPLYCYDLKSATDRLPAILGATLLSGLVGAHLANQWLILLTSRDFKYKYKKDSGSVYYSVGQPMGAYTSWSLGLSQQHHCLVQLCAHNCGHKGWFSAYALLGDDIVIADTQVADAYQLLQKRLDVKVGLAKSLVSTKGLALEFAKRFYYRGVNCSPISIKEMQTASTFASAAEQAIKYEVNLSTYLKLIGFGYKTLASVNRKLSLMGSTLRLRVQHYRLFVTGMSPEQVSPVDTDGLKELLERERRSLIDRLSSLRSTVKQLSNLTTVDRTRAHYGTIEYEDENPLYDLFLVLERPFTPEEKRWLHGTFEYIYRDHYIDGPIFFSRLNSRLEEEQEFKDVTSLWNMLDELEELLVEIKPLALARKEPHTRVIPARFLRFFETYSNQFPHIRHPK